MVRGLALGTGWLGLVAPAWAGPAGDPAVGPTAVSAAQVSEGTGHTSAVGRLQSYVGLGVGVGWSLRRLGDPAVASDRPGTLAATGGYGALHGRLAGYAERSAHGAPAVLMVLPELMLDLELGGTAARRDAGARALGLAERGGVAVGLSGVTTIGAGWATHGTVGVYGRVAVGQRFSAQTNTVYEGAYYLATLGPGAGLRVARHRVFTLLLGAGLDGVLGVQRLNAAALVAQLAPVGELGIYTQPRPDVYFGVVARGDGSVLGQRYGGQRLHGRATAEVVWKVARGGPFRFVGVVLVYEGTRVDAGPEHPQFDPRGERRSGQRLLLACGATF